MSRFPHTANWIAPLRSWTSVLYLCLYLAAPLTRANIIETFDFETGNLSQLGSTDIEGTSSAKVSASTDYARQGDYAMRIQIKNADKRAEGVSSMRAAIGKPYWYGWSIYVPEDYQGDTTFDIVSQFHDWHRKQPEWAQDGVAPTCFLFRPNGDFQLDLKYQIAPETTKHKSFKLGPWVPGAWHDIVVHVNWTYEDTGFLQVWVNGVQKVDYTGPTYLDYEAGNGPFFKMGDYKGIDNWSGSSPRVFYMDEYRMGDSNASYDDVDPARERASTRVLVYEGFDYGAGPINGTDGGVGWDGAWTEQGGGGDASVISSGSTYPGLETTGNRFRIYDSDGKSQSIFRRLSRNIGEIPGTYWLAFFGKKNSSGREGYLQFGDLSFRAYQANDWQFKTPNKDYTTLSGASYGATHLFLVRMNASPAGNTVSVWVNPDLAAGEPSQDSALATLKDSAFFSFNTVTIRHGPWGGNASQSSEWDEIRIGQNYQDIMEMTTLTQQDTFEEWKGRWDITADDDDSDGDGIEALLEYAWHLDPSQHDAEGAPTIGISGNYLTLTYRRLSEAADITYKVKVCGDLHDWQPATVAVGEPVDNGDGTETVIERDTVPFDFMTPRFILLDVTVAP